MHKSLITLLIAIFAFMAESATPLTPRDELDGVLKIAAYAFWPDSTAALRIMMAPQSEESLSQAAQYLEGRTFNGMPIELSEYKPECNLDGIMVIYIEQGSPASMEAIAARIPGSRILTITNDPNNLPLGCMFAISAQGSRLDYTFNKQAVIDSGLKMHISLLTPRHSMTGN